MNCIIISKRKLVNREKYQRIFLKIFEETFEKKPLQIRIKSNDKMGKEENMISLKQKEDQKINYSS